MFAGAAWSADGPWCACSGRSPRLAGSRRRRSSSWCSSGAAIAVLSLSSGSSSSESSLLTGSGYPNGNTSNTRYTQGPIDSASVDAARGPPGRCRWREKRVRQLLVLADPLRRGDLLPRPGLQRAGDRPEDRQGDLDEDLRIARPGTERTRSWRGRVYGATATAAFALDEKTGEQLWSVTLVAMNTRASTWRPATTMASSTSRPCRGTTKSSTAGGGVGILWALEAGPAGSCGISTRRPKTCGPRERNINSGGGMWYSPAFDEQGYMYVGTGNPAPFPGTESAPMGIEQARSRTCIRTRSSSSTRTTGKLQWYYQMTPHDLYDWDLQDPPILAERGRQAGGDRGRQGGLRARARRQRAASCCGSARSEPTTATTTTTCTR